MNRHFYILLGLCLLGPVRTQTFEMQAGDTINIIDVLGKKQGRWIVYGKNKSGSCYGPDKKVEEGKYSDNRKVSVWIDYHCNGNIRSKITFISGRPDGYALIYHENGKISEEGVWKNNRWVGNYKLYYDNGQVQHEFVFNGSGKRDGPQKYYYDNGQLAIEGNFAAGKETGLIKEYYENGDIKAEKNFNDGTVDIATVKEYQPKKPLMHKSELPADNAPHVKVKDDEKPNEAVKKDIKGPTVLNGQYTLYNKNKQITKDGVFKDNRLIDGKAYIYDDNGILQRAAVYKNGIYVGDAQVEN